MKKPPRRASKVPDFRVDSFASAVCELFDFVADSQVWIKDREGQYCWMNRPALLDYGVERLEQVRGKTDYDLSPTHIADQFRLDDERVLAGHRVVNRVELVGRFDHTAFWSVTNKVPLRNAAGRVIGTAGITRPLSGKALDQTWPTPALGKVIAYIREHYDESMSNRELSRMMSVSERAFERNFRHWFFVSPQQFIKGVRVRMACRALVAGAQPLAQVAADHGFYDQSHFTRECRRLTGKTPRGYRDQYRPRAD
jgi:AraC-like DNA-binding protein